ncbi:MAG: hypothetical protein ACLQBX_08050 [Candidatus Limnocylindrales bacterium]
MTAAPSFGRTNDTLLFCVKSDEYTGNPQHVEHDPDYVRVCDQRMSC